jgi:hypothetical protein
MSSPEVDHVILPEGLAHAVIYGGDADDWKWGESFDEERLAAFNEAYETLGNQFLGDPKETWYQGVTFTAVIRRKADGKLFGYQYWEAVAKHGEPYVEANGYEFDDAGDSDFVFLPVAAFPITGYVIQKEPA